MAVTQDAAPTFRVGPVEAEVLREVRDSELRLAQAGSRAARVDTDREAGGFDLDFALTAASFR